jgi:hypothetical protein
VILSIVLGTNSTSRSRSASPFRFNAKHEDVNSMSQNPNLSNPSTRNIADIHQNGCAETPQEENTMSTHGVVSDEDVLFPTGWHEEVEPKCEVIYRNHVNYGDYWYFFATFQKFLNINSS